MSIKEALRSFGEQTKTLLTSQTWHEARDFSLDSRGYIQCINLNDLSFLMSDIHA